MSVIKVALRLAAAAALAATLSSAASAAVYPPQRQLPAQVISDFKGSPNSLLQQYPVGGPQLVSRVRDLGASDPTTLPGLIALLKDPRDHEGPDARDRGRPCPGRPHGSADRPSLRQ
ncbi:hypothetical protein ACVWXO_000024 [Bradyrhizobium sp. LM2.7]